MNEGDKKCMDSCGECGTTCLRMVKYCLEKGGSHAEPSHIQALLDCAEICRLSESFMARGSAYAAQVCALCADICRTCASSCDAMGNDEEMKKCAEVCRRCADSCRAVS